MSQSEPPITERAPAPEIYCEGFTCAATAGGVAKLSMFSVAHTNGNDPERRIVARIAMPLGAIVGTYEGLGRLIEQLKEQGTLIESKPPNA